MSATPFLRDREVDKPGIVGARWWQKTLADPMPRRKAITAILVVTGALLGFGLIIGATVSAARSNYEYQPRKALELQREYGWSFGAATEDLVFDGSSVQPFDREQVKNLGTDLKPVSPRLLPFHVGTLFESLGAKPRSVTAENPETIVPLLDVLKPIFTPSMASAYTRGGELALAIAAASEMATSTAIVVDLEGPDAVAFAAGMSAIYAPVFLLDNWPHPRGVVPSHLALAAAAYFQPTFAKHVAPGDARPVMVLDRRRLATYGDDSSQFDNRYVARMPSGPMLSGLGVKRVVYVAPTTGDRELDDLNDDFVAMSTAGIEFQLAPVLVVDDPLGPSPPHGRNDRVGTIYTPAPRPTSFSSGSLRGTRPMPIAFGTVPVAIALGTGLLLGAKLSRSGSWNRSSTSGGG